MADQSPEPDPYLAEHVREALGKDSRVSELGVEVEISGQTVILSGAVTSAERQAAAAAVAHDLLPQHQVRNETRVAELPEPTDSEHLP
jgi:osmotically-inducible protein OsmY